MKKIYKGFLQLEDHGDADDLIYIKGDDYPILEQIQDDIEEYGNLLSVRYFLSDKNEDINKLTENLIKSISGSADIDYGSHYSEYTGYLWTDQDLKIGGHDLADELYNNAQHDKWNFKTHEKITVPGKWLYAEIEYNSPTQPKEK